MFSSCFISDYIFLMFLFFGDKKKLFGPSRPNVTICDEPARSVRWLKHTSSPTRPQKHKKVQNPKQNAQTSDKVTATTQAKLTISAPRHLPHRLPPRATRRPPHRGCRRPPATLETTLDTIKNLLCRSVRQQN